MSFKIAARFFGIKIRKKEVEGVSIHSPGNRVIPIRKTSAARADEIVIKQAAMLNGLVVDAEKAEERELSALREKSLRASGLIRTSS